MTAPGDVGFCRQKGWIPFWIRFAQARKYHRSPASRYNHCFLIVGWNGELLQAIGSGIERGHLSDYGPADNLAMRRPPYLPPGAAVAAEAMEELFAHHERYGMLTILSVALSLLTGTKLRFNLSGQEICSGAVAYALTRANIDCGPDESFDTPADLMWIAITQNWENVA